MENKKVINVKEKLSEEHWEKLLELYDWVLKLKKKDSFVMFPTDDWDKLPFAISIILKEIISIKQADVHHVSIDRFLQIRGAVTDLLVSYNQEENNKEKIDFYSLLDLQKEMETIYPKGGRWF
tara:strand:- start:586 stop:954 length:369 start_codon:yes stop_codon:yes gene_type:complete